MQKRALGETGIDIAPVVFGGNVFGWTVDETESFRLLDTFVDAGFNAIDTADAYSRFVPGNSGGESETIIGNWLAANPSKRDKVKIFTKVGSDMGEGNKGLSDRWIREAIEHSLERLKTDHVDLYFSHWHDPDTRPAETLGAYQRLLDEGKVYAIGASNHDVDQLGEALKVAQEENLPRYQVIQPEFNLYDRTDYEVGLQDLAQRENLGVVTYFSLAAGFLTGKYRDESDLEGSARKGKVGNYMTDRGRQILHALDAVAQRHNTKPAAVALAWIMAQGGVTAPIASATSLDQLETLMAAGKLSLAPEDIEELREAGE